MSFGFSGTLLCGAGWAAQGVNNEHALDTTDPSVVLKPLVKPLLGNVADFQLRWDALMESFHSWITSLPVPVSPLARDLELLRRIVVEFKADRLREDDAVIEAVLRGTAKEGDCIRIGEELWSVIDRAVTPNFGVGYVLRNKQGETIRREFFD
jgi:hypothetical protein